MLVATLAVTGVLAGWSWLGAAALLPLLYALPCIVMMAMCMRGHGGSHEKGTSKPDGASGDPGARRGESANQHRKLGDPA